MEEFFLSLIKLGIGNARVVPVPKQIDWNTLEDLAARQGLSAIIVDGIERMPEEKRPPKMVLLQWIGETLQSYEYRYDQYRKAIAELAVFYSQHGFKMMLLKGYACSLNWPKPEHRPCGDIDIWLFGRQKEADAELEAWFKSSNGSKVQDFKIDNSHHHHSVYNWGEFMVENHYDFVNVYAHKSSRELEKIFKELGQDDTQWVDMVDTSTGSAPKVYLPSPNLHALFLIKHMVSHFAAANITLRQVLDWAFFVEKHSKEVDWDWLVDVLEKYHMMDFYNCINAICVEDLGFDSRIFPYVQFSPFMKNRILKDILNPEFSGKEPKSVFLRIPFKYRRWKSNRWKHELCYKESMWSAFWSGVWNHILKPKSI